MSELINNRSYRQEQLKQIIRICTAARQWMK